MSVDAIGQGLTQITMDETLRQNLIERGHGTFQVGQKASPLAVGLRDHSMRTPGQFQQTFPRELAISEAEEQEIGADVSAKIRDRFGVVQDRLEGQPGIERITDQADLLKKLFTLTGMFRLGALGVGILMLVSSALLIANTVRMGLFARRKEIGIMKLVGATNWFIRIPFLIEGVVEGLIGAGLAVGVLFAFKALFINPLYGNIRILPWVQTGDVIATIPWLVASGVVVALLASFAGMRRFLDI